MESASLPFVECYADDKFGAMEHCLDHYKKRVISCEEIDIPARKPAKWEDLPWTILEHILWNYIDLEYDGYETSKAEWIHDFSNEVAPIYGYTENKARIDAFWKHLSEMRFREIVFSVKNELEMKLENVNKYL